MIYRIAADTVLLVHLAFILFVVAGGLLALRWPRVIWIHLPAAAWGALIELGGWVCPLTPLENELRIAGGGAGYAGGFIEEYLVPVIYPPGLGHGVQVLLGVGVIVVNMAIYGTLLSLLLRRRRQQPDASSAAGAQPSKGPSARETGRFSRRLKWSPSGPGRASGGESPAPVLPRFLEEWLDHLDLAGQLSEEVDRLLAKQMSLPPTHEFERQARAAAEATHALPVAFEAGGCFLLHSNGDVFWCAWDNDALPEREVSCRLRWQALRAAARAFPGLRGLVPPPPEAAVSCRACSGKGTSEKGGRQTDDCPDCWGLGWGLPGEPRRDSGSIRAGNQLQGIRERVESSRLDE